MVRRGESRDKVAQVYKEAVAEATDFCMLSSVSSVQPAQDLEGFVGRGQEGAGTMTEPSTAPETRMRAFIRYWKLKEADLSANDREWLEFKQILDNKDAETRGLHSKISKMGKLASKFQSERDTLRTLCVRMARNIQDVQNGLNYDEGFSILAQLPEDIKKEIKSGT